MKNKINISKRAQKDLRKAPKHIVRNFQEWALVVENEGIKKARKIKGYHDEPLKEIDLVKGQPDYQNHTEYFMKKHLVKK